MWNRAEADRRFQHSHGDGVLSDDAGKRGANGDSVTPARLAGWSWIQESRCRYVAAIGHFFRYGPKEKRGVVRSQDGCTQLEKKFGYSTTKPGQETGYGSERHEDDFAGTWKILRMPWDIHEFGPREREFLLKLLTAATNATQLKDGLPRADRENRHHSFSGDSKEIVGKRRRY